MKFFWTRYAAQHIFYRKHYGWEDKQEKRKKTIERHKSGEYKEEIIPI